ncbi:MAG: DNA-binding protein WhiA [Bacillota bacterium]
MSFTVQVREELARVIPERSCCRRAELLALWWYGRRQGSWLVESAATARKVVRLSRGAWGAPPRVQTVRAGNHYRFLVSPPVALPALGEPESMPRAWCCRRSFLRGVFLASGWVADPGRGNHLELVFPSREAAEGVLALLQEERLPARLARRQGGYLIYLKDGEQVSRFLTLAGAYQSVMRFENVRALKEVKNLVNRLVNAETANLGKVVEASWRQVEDIRAILAAGMWDQLPRALQEVALARLRYPEVSLRELGETLQPPVGKSGVNHRLRRLHWWADRARSAGIGEGVWK